MKIRNGTITAGLLWKVYQMTSFRYIARDLSGQRRQGAREAVSSNDVLGWLREQSMTPISVDEVSVTVKKTNTQARRKRINSADLSAICWQLNTMVEGGIIITSAIEIVADDVENLQLQKILRHILEKMQRGETLSDSLSEFPNVFNPLSRAIILAGETSGNMPAALCRLADYFDNRDKLAKKVKGAMAYPIFVLGFIILIVIFIMTFIVPRFQIVFDQFGGELPAFTQGFMAFYDMLRFNVIYIIGALLLVSILTIATSKTPKGHRFFCRIVLGLPLIGKILNQSFITAFCQTMATLLSAGVSVLEVFDILSTMTNNDIIKTAITHTKEQIVEGSSVSLSMASTGFFPNILIKMVEVGEKSGSLSKVLEKTASYYERKVDTMITMVMNLLEPIMIVTVGGIVMVVVLALYLPIFSMGQ